MHFPLLAWFETDSNQAETGAQRTSGSEIRISEATLFTVTSLSQFK
jgi:hypothetical protein